MKQLKDQFKRPKGELRIIITDKRTGRVARTIVRKNLYLNRARYGAVRLLAGAAADLDAFYIDQLSIGTNGTPPDPADAAITAPLTVAVGITFPSVNNVRFAASIPVGTPAVATEYREAGLLFHDGSLATRVTFGVETKGGPGDPWSWAIVWTIVWS